MLLKVKSHVLNSINHLWLGVWYIIMNIAPVVDLEGAEPAPPPPYRSTVKRALQNTIWYDTRFCFNVRSNADMSQRNLPHRA